MLVLKIIAVVLFLAFILYCVVKYNEYCLNKYKCTFINKRTILYYFGFFGAIWFGGILWKHAIDNNGDKLNGILIVLIALIWLGVIIYKNIEKSSLFGGIIASIVQIALFSISFIISIYVFIIFIVLSFFASFLAIGAQYPKDYDKEVIYVERN